MLKDSWVKVKPHFNQAAVDFLARFNLLNSRWVHLKVSVDKPKANRYSADKLPLESESISLLFREALGSLNQHREASSRLRSLKCYSSKY